MTNETLMIETTKEQFSTLVNKYMMSEIIEIKSSFDGMNKVVTCQHLGDTIKLDFWRKFGEMVCESIENVTMNQAFKKTK